MHSVYSVAFLSAAGLASASVLPRKSGSVQDVVVFGDSYSDNCQLWRLTSRPNVTEAYPFPSCPPAPTGRWSGGEAWPEIFENGTGVSTHNYAIAGATCSNTYFDRYIADYNGDLVNVPGVDEQIRSFVANGTDRFDFSKTVAAVFIGTNDINFITNALQYNPPTENLTEGRTISDEAQCVTERVTQLYKVGFRRIVMFENIPLQRTPYFSYDSVPGYGQYLDQNGTAISTLTQQLVAANNALQAVYIPAAAESLSKANVTIFGTYKLFDDLLDNPSSALGSNANMAGFCNVCDRDGECTLCPNLENYAFWDPLHPSEAADQVIARDFAAHLGVTYSNPLSA